MSHLDRYLAERRAYLEEALERKTIDATRFAYHIGHLEEEGLVTGTPLERLAWANTYSRMPALLDCYGRRDFWSLVGRHWARCDNVSAFAEPLLPILQKARRHAPMRSAMTDDDCREYDRLPDVVKIWRGCYYKINECGFSWTLSRKIAARFPTLPRYTVRDGWPLLLEGRIEKRRILFYKNAEQEVVVLMQDVLLESQSFITYRNRAQKKAVASAGSTTNIQAII